MEISNILEARIELLGSSGAGCGCGGALAGDSGRSGVTSLVISALKRSVVSSRSLMDARTHTNHMKNTTDSQVES